MKCWEQGDITEKVTLSLFFNLHHDKGWGKGENDTSQVTRFKTWRQQSQHTTPALSRKGSYLLCSN